MYSEENDAPDTNLKDNSKTTKIKQNIWKQARKTEVRPDIPFYVSIYP